MSAPVRPAPLDARSLGDFSDTVGNVTEFLANLEGRIHAAETELQRLNNAIRGGAAGAQAGYNMPTNWKPFLIGGAVLLGLMVLPKLAGRR